VLVGKCFPWGKLSPKATDEGRSSGFAEDSGFYIPSSVTAYAAPPSPRGRLFIKVKGAVALFCFATAPCFFILK
jgi:hypothetical protein